MNEQRMLRDYSIGVLEALTLLRKHVVHIVLVCLVFVLVGVGGTKLFVKPVYEANATLIVNTRNNVGSVVTNDEITSAEKLVDTYAVIITSRAVLEKVIDELQLGIDYRQLVKKVSVEPVNGTQIIGVSVRMQSVEAAEMILREILRVAPDVIVEAVEAGSVKTIDEAFADDNPVSPQMSVIGIVSMLLGIVVSCVCIIGHHLMQNVYRSEQELELDLGIAVLGSIPKIS